MFGPCDNSDHVMSWAETLISPISIPMGLAHSYPSTETALTAVVLAGALAVGYHQYTATSGDAPRSTGSMESTETSSGRKTKKKKKKAPEDNTLPSPPSPSTSHLARPPATIPGQFDADASLPSSNSKAKKPKKKTKQSNTDPVPSLPPSTNPPAPIPTPRSWPQQQSTTSIDTDASWTRVEPRRKGGREDQPSSVDLTTSDAGITSSVTGNSSPVDGASPDKRTTLAEKLVPKPPQTEVDELRILFYRSSRVALILF